MGETLGAAGVSVEGGGQLGLLTRRMAWVPGHDSRFLSAGIGLGYSKLRLEMSARRYRTSFDEVTRNVTLQGATEIDRRRRAENSWGGIAALVLVTR